MMTKINLSFDSIVSKMAMNKEITPSTRTSSKIGARNFRFLLIFAFGCSTTALPAVAQRRSINFNREWRFQLGDVANAGAATFDDSNWSAANLSHSFSMPYFAADWFYVGYGWYRKHFEASAAWSGQRVSLEFDGVFQVAEVFVNGRRIGEHKGG
jgi:beta-galactosidase